MNQLINLFKNKYQMNEIWVKQCKVLTNLDYQMNQFGSNSYYTVKPKITYLLNRLYQLTRFDQNLVILNSNL